MNQHLRAFVSYATPMLVLCAQAIARAQAEPTVPAQAPEAAVDPSSTDALLATKLFIEGRRLLQDHKPQMGCPLIEQSHRLAPSLGTVLNLALCNEHNGNLATAHDYYRRAETMATLAADTKRQEFAHDAAAALAARRASLVLQVAGKSDLPFEVHLDEELQSNDILSRPVFLDAGEHPIAVRAAGYQPWYGSVTVQDGGKHVVIVPALQPDGGAATNRTGPHAPTTLAGPRSNPSLLLPPPAKPDPGLGTGRVVALSVGGAGIVSLGASLLFTILARTTYDKAKCSDINICTPEGVRLRADAMSHASRATVFGVAGGVALAGGVVLWFLTAPDPAAPERSPVSVQLGGGGVGAQWRGRL